MAAQATQALTRGTAFNEYLDYKVAGYPGADLGVRIFQPVPWFNISNYPAFSSIIQHYPT
jgi:hypothetical protein